MTPKQRTRARIIQALYQWRLGGDDLDDIKNQFLANKKDRISRGYFKEVLIGISKDIDNLNKIINSFLDNKDVKELGYTEHAILLLSCYEFLYKIEIPYKVVINEAIELAKIYGAEKSHKYINAILDKLAQDIRSLEIKNS